MVVGIGTAMLAELECEMSRVFIEADPEHRLEDINKSCLEQFRRHWNCLEQNNQQMWQCRRDEWSLNTCVFDNLVCIHASRGMQTEDALPRPLLIYVLAVGIGKEDTGSAEERDASTSTESHDIFTQ